MVDAKDKHVFVVTAVDLADDPGSNGVAVKLTDARGGQVTLHLSADMAELLRQKVATAADKQTGP